MNQTWLRHGFVIDWRLNLHLYLATLLAVTLDVLLTADQAMGVDVLTEHYSSSIMAKHLHNLTTQDGSSALTINARYVCGFAALVRKQSTKPAGVTCTKALIAAVERYELSVVIAQCFAAEPAKPHPCPIHNGGQVR